MSDPSSTEYFRKNKPANLRDSEPDPMDQRAATFEKQLAELAKVAARLEKIAAIESDVHERATVKRPPPSPGPQVSAQLTRQNLRLRVSVGVLGVGSLALTIGGVNVLSYAYGLTKNGDKSTTVIAETESVRKKIDDHETRITEAVQAQVVTTQQNATEIRHFGELQLLQWQYMGEAIEAIRRKREIPKKPQVLIDAEARALVSIRDTK